MTLQKIPQLWSRFLCFLKRKNNRDCLTSLDVDSSGESQSAAGKGSRAKTTVQCRKQRRDERHSYGVGFFEHSKARERSSLCRALDMPIEISSAVLGFRIFKTYIFTFASWPPSWHMDMRTWVGGWDWPRCSLRHKIAVLTYQSRSLPLFWAPGFLGPTVAFTAWPPSWHLDLKTWVGPEAYDTSFIHLHPHHR
jgi:hypothetical protein